MKSKSIQPEQGKVVTIRDIASASGFSNSTVSTVLSGGPGAQRISEKTRQTVLTIATQLRYRPNLFARTLRGNRSSSIGVVVFDITDPYCAQILQAIETHLKPSGYFPIITDLQNDPGQINRYLDILQGHRVEGIIAIANPIGLGSSLFDDVTRRSMPTVIIGRGLQSGKISSVSVDNEKGASLAIRHLHELGHSRIAFIKGPESLADSGERWNGILQFATEMKLELKPKLIVEMRGRNTSYAEAYQLTEELLSRRVKFTALVAFDDLTACAAIRALSKAGMRVPTDCSVVGFDDIPSSAFYNPSLTTIHQQLELQGSIGAAMIEDLINSSIGKRVYQPKNRKVEPKLIMRDSTAPAMSV